MLTDLAGSAPVPLGPAQEYGSSFDFDGRRVVQAIPVCRGYVIVAESLADIRRRGPRGHPGCRRR